MSTLAQGQRILTTKQEGIVVWDQHGLIVVWPDGHCSRFAWTALRQGCPCSECHPSQTQDEAEGKGFATGSVPSAPEPTWQMH